MNILFILFFLSLLGITVMVGRKVWLLPEGEVVGEDYEHPFVDDVERLKHATLHHSKKIGRLGLIATIRFYLKSRHFIKNKYETSKEKILKLNVKNGTNGEKVEKVEVSKYLKVISTYKNRIRALKHKIKEEENL